MKLAIDNNALAEDFFSDTRVLGIVVPVKDYRFCWVVNQALGCDFRLNNDLEIQLAKKGRQYFFSIYEYNEPGSSLGNYIYSSSEDAVWVNLYIGSEVKVPVKKQTLGLSMQTEFPWMM